jgi:hypothetical protein
VAVAAVTWEVASAAATWVASAEAASPVSAADHGRFRIGDGRGFHDHAFRAMIAAFLAVSGPDMPTTTTTAITITTVSSITGSRTAANVPTSWIRRSCAYRKSNSGI